MHAACPRSVYTAAVRRWPRLSRSVRMKKWHEWAFLALLIALAIAGGWAKERQSANLADSNKRLSSIANASG